MKNVLFFCATLIIMVAQVFGQNSGTIKGKLFDGDTKETLPGAYVTLSGSNTTLGCQTDVNGNFVIKPLPSGMYTLKISYLGYKTIIIDDIIVNPDKITFIDDLYLENPGITMDDTIPEIRAYRDPLIRPDPLTIIRPDEYGKIADKRDLSSVISKMNSDIYTNDNGELYFRGARSDNFVYFVDGVKSVDGEAHIPSGAIGSISIYTGGVPAQYGDFTGGCIVIETKSFFSN